MAITRPEMTADRARALHELHNADASTRSLAYRRLLELFPHLTPEFICAQLGLDTPNALRTVGRWGAPGCPVSVRAMPHILRLAENPRHIVPPEAKQKLQNVFLRGQRAACTRTGQSTPVVTPVPSTPFAKPKATRDELLYSELTTLLSALGRESLLAITKILARNPDWVSRSELRTMIKRATLLLRCGQDPKVFDKLVQHLDELDDKS